MMKTVVVIGGGIAGSSCAEYILENEKNCNLHVIIVTPKDVIKTAVTKTELTKTLKEIEVLEKKVGEYHKADDRLSVKVGFVIKIDSKEMKIKLKSGETIKYDKVCICTGAVPNIIRKNPYVLSLRDTDNAKDLKKKLSSAKKIIVVGNGGIALELVYEISGCEIVWCIKDESIGNTFFDEAAAKFLIPTLDKDFNLSTESGKNNQTIFKRKRHESQKKLLLHESDTNTHGSALGPDWSSQQKLEGSLKNTKRQVEFEYSCHLTDVWCGGKSDVDNVYVKLSNGKVVGGDFIVSATGVCPNVPFELPELERSSDGGINVDCQMKTNLPNVFAAGDVCTPVWEESETWFPMKLWTQAWQMGLYAGKCILNNITQEEEISLDMCFELFSHVTSFFGYKVCLLGCFNGQKLNESEYEILLRITNNVEYVKVILKNGRLKGCLLIGETDLEETFENLILNELDIGFLGESLLDPGVDIEDYFD